MFSRSSDQQTLNTLRALHSNGMLSGAELDEQVAADLLSGSSPHSRKGSVADSLGAPKRVTPRRLDPLSGAPQLPDPMAELDDGGKGPLSDEYMRQLTHHCDNFDNKMQENTALAKELLNKSLVEVFVLNSQEKLPDCFLRSLPKFGKGAKDMNGIFSRSLNKNKADSIADRKEVPFELQIQEDVIDEIGKDIEHVIETEMKRCFGAMTNDMQHVLKAVGRLKDRVETLEEELQNERREKATMQATVDAALASEKELQDRVKRLEVQAQEKETQMDIVSDQVKRRNLMLDEQRARFHKEVIRYKTKIYELQERLQSGDTGPSATSRTRGPTNESFGPMSMEPIDMTMNTTSASDNHELVEAVDAATREIKEQMLDNIRKLKADQVREKKELLQQKKLAIDERDNEIYHLKMNIKSMDRIIEVEKRRLMKNRELEMKEVQEKYEQKIAAMQSELDQLKKGP